MLLISPCALTWQGNKFDIGGGEQFDGLSDLLEYYKKHPLVELTGAIVHLRQVTERERGGGRRRRRRRRKNKEGGRKQERRKKGDKEGARR